MKCCQIPLCLFPEAIMPYMSKALGEYSVLDLYSVVTPRHVTYLNNIYQYIYGKQAAPKTKNMSF